MTKEGCTKIVTFMTPRALVLVLGCGHISLKVKILIFKKNLLLYSGVDTGYDEKYHHIIKKYHHIMKPNIII